MLNLWILWVPSNWRCPTFSSTLTFILFLFSMYGSGQVLWLASAPMRQGHVVSERAHHRITGSSHNTSVISRAEKCLWMSVLVLLNADWLKILPVTNSTLTCIAMREMQGTMQQREPPATINSYNAFSNQMGLLNEHIEHPLPSSPQATLTDSTLELETLVLVLIFNAFRFTTGLLPAELMVLWPTRRLLCLLSAIMQQWQTLQCVLPIPAIWQACRSHVLRTEGVRILPPVPVIQDTNMLHQCHHSAEVSETMQWNVNDEVMIMLWWCRGDIMMTAWWGDDRYYSQTSRFGLQNFNYCVTLQKWLFFEQYTVLAWYPGLLKLGEEKVWYTLLVHAHN